jgi:hypothetical protein
LAVRVPVKVGLAVSATVPVAAGSVKVYSLAVWVAVRDTEPPGEVLDIVPPEPEAVVALAYCTVVLDEPVTIYVPL